MTRKKDPLEQYAPSEKLENMRNWGDLIEYIGSPKFNKDDYLAIIAGNSGFNIGYTQSSFNEAIKDCKFNNPENNEKILNEIFKDLQKEYKSKKDYVSRYGERNIKSITENLKLSDKTINTLLNDKDYWIKDRYDVYQPNNGILNSPYLKPEHLYRFVNNHPDYSGEILNHGLADDRLESIIMEDPEKFKDIPDYDLNRYINRKRTKDDEENNEKINIPYKQIKNIIEQRHDKLEYDDFDSLINSLSPEDRKDFIDKKIGLSGSKWRAFDTPEEYDLSDPEQAAEWDKLNWGQKEHGAEYNNVTAQRLAHSKHLTDDQIDYIKRNGDFNSKYNLYHNKHIDPKHGVEMYRKWANDESDAGYDSSELIEKYKKDKRNVYTIDDLPEGTINEEDFYDNGAVYDIAEEDYSFRDYIRDNLDELAQDLDISDKTDELYDKLHEDYSDWEGDNPEYDYYRDAPVNKVLEKLKEVAENDPEGDGDVYRRHIDQVEGAEDVIKKKMGGIYIPTDENDLILIDDINNNIVPETIDFADNDNYTVNDHPDFDERIEETELDFKKDLLENSPYDYYDSFGDDYRESDGYSEAERSAIDYLKEEAAKEHYNELYSNYAHQDDRFVPSHLTRHIPELQELKQSRKKLTGEGKASGWLKEVLPKKDYEYEYGEGQHHLEMVKDYADAKGGSIDAGTMHKIYPNLKEEWKKIFGSKGKLTSDEIQQKINTIPKTKYDVSYGQWGKTKMQNTNSQDQVVFRLDHSDESLKPLQEDPDLFNTFEKVQETSKRSGHPTLSNTIGWARVDTTDPKHWWVDETQSDFGKEVIKYLKKEGAEDKAQHVEKIRDYHKNWREVLLNHIIKQAKKHGVEKISTHSPESKAAHVGASNIHSTYKKGYQQVPRMLGFTPANADQLALTNESREDVFNKTKDKINLLQRIHINGWEEHNKWSDWYRYIMKNNKDPKIQEGAKKGYEYHNDIAQKHHDRAKIYGVPHESIVSHTVDTEPLPENINDTEDYIRNNKNYEFENDKDLNTSPIDTSKPEYLQGHILNLKPTLKKSYFGIKINILKAEEDFRAPKKPKFDLPHVAPENPDLVHADYHGFGGEMNSIPGQRELIHGINMKTGTPIKGTHHLTIGTKIYENPLTNKKMIVKPTEGVGADPNQYPLGPKELQAKLGHVNVRGHNAARREVMFYNMANKFFNLGNYTPVTSGFTKKNQDYSAQEFVDAHSLFPRDYNSGLIPKEVENNYHKALKTHNLYGNLHKVALMDFIMGHHDRHKANFMLNKKNNNLHLIDNGNSFDYGQDDLTGAKDVPAYLLDAEKLGISNVVHPEAKKWLNGLSEDQALKIWDDYGYDKDNPSVQGFLKRLKLVKEIIGQAEGQYNLSQLLSNIRGAERDIKDETPPTSFPSLPTQPLKKTKKPSPIKRKAIRKHLIKDYLKYIKKLQYYKNGV